MTTALQNIERAKGAKAERMAILAEMRKILKLYGGKDVILQALIAAIKDRGRS